VVKIGRPEDVTHAKVLIFGPPGHGKTRLLGTLADDERTSPTLFLDFEGGVSSLIGRDIDVVRVRDWPDFEEAYDLLADPKTPYKSTAVDSLSETQIGGLLRILEKDKKRADPDQLAQPDWGLILVQMRRFVRAFVDLDMHVFMSAVSTEDLDPREGRIVVPSFQGAFKQEVAMTFDTVGYLALSEDENGETERVLLLNDQPKFRVKARTPMGVVAPSELVDPTAGKLLDVLGFARAKTTGRKAAKEDNES
jgi:hypothetical protein